MQLFHRTAQETAAIFRDTDVAPADGRGRGGGNVVIPATGRADTSRIPSPHHVATGQREAYQPRS